MPVTFTDEDFDQVAAGNYIVKVVYLPDPQYQDLATLGTDEVVSSRLEPGKNPVAEAQRRGSLLLIVRMGNINPRTGGHIVTESGSCLSFDGECGIGQWISEVCSGHAIRLARATGIGLAVARESNHFGAAAFWAQRMSAAGMIGIVMCNASPLVAPWQGKDQRFGTNPICMSVPGPNTWLLDMATTFGKPKTLAILNENTDFGTSGARSAKEWAEKKDLKKHGCLAKKHKQHKKH